MTTVVVPEPLLGTIMQLLTPGGLPLAPREETRQLIRSVATLGAELLPDGRDLSVPHPIELELPIIGAVTHRHCTLGGVAPTVGVSSDRTGRQLLLHVTTGETGLTVVGATVREVTDDPSQPCAWSFAAIGDVETRSWGFAGDGWRATLSATRRGTDPWSAVCIRRSGGSFASSISIDQRFEDVPDAFDALIGHLPAAATPEHVWLPDSRLHAPCHERVRVPRSAVQRFAALLVPSGQTLPPEEEVHGLITRLVRLGAPYVRGAGQDWACSFRDVSLPVLGRVQPAFVVESDRALAIGVKASDGSYAAVQLWNVGGYAHVGIVQYVGPESAAASMHVQQWAFLCDATAEMLVWILVIDGAAKTQIASRRIGATNWTAQLDPPGDFALAQQAFEALVNAELPDVAPTDPEYPDSRLRD